MIHLSVKKRKAKNKKINIVTTSQAQETSESPLNTKISKFEFILQKKKWLAWLIIIIFALLVRAIYFYYMYNNYELFNYPVVDERTYLEQADVFANNNFSLKSLQTPFWQPPGYVFILSVLRKLGLSIIQIKAVQCLVGIINLLLLYVLALKVLKNKTKSLLAALIFSIYPPMLRFEIQLLKPVWVILLNLSFLNILYSKQLTKFKYVIVGLLVGLSALLQAYILLFPLFIFLYDFIKNKYNPKIILNYSFMLLGIILMVSPITYINKNYGNDNAIISTNGGINFYIGNSENFRYTYNLPPGTEYDLMVNSPKFKKNIYQKSSQSKYFYKEVFFYYKKTPRAVLINLVKKFSLIFSIFNLPRNIYFNNLLCTNIINIVFLLSLTCMFFCNINKLYLYSFTLILVQLVFFPTTRYLISLFIIAPIFFFQITFKKLYSKIIFIFFFFIIFSNYQNRLIFDVNKWQAHKFLILGEKNIKLKTYHQAEKLYLTQKMH